MSEGYAITSAAAGLAATAFTWSSGFTTGRSRLNDGIQDEIASGSAAPQASGQTLVFDLGSVQQLSGLALLNHNLGVGACSVRVDAADDAGFTVNFAIPKLTTAVNTAAPYEKDTLLQWPAISRRYWKLTFTHTGTKTITLGELLAFTTITTLSRASIYGASEEERYVLNRVESDTGNVRSSFLAGNIRTKTLPFKDMVGTSQRDEMMGMWRATRGGNSNLLYVDLIESTNSVATGPAMQCLWGRLQTSFGWSQPDFNLYDVNAFTLVGQGREAGS